MSSEHLIDSLSDKLIKAIIDNFDEIENGISLKRTRELGIHECCKRQRVQRDEKASYLYFLIPKYRELITSSISTTNNDETTNKELITNRNQKEINQVKELLDELGSPDDKEQANSSSSFLINETANQEEEIKNDLAKSIYRSFTRGACAATGTFHRSVLLRYWFNQLCSSGVSSTQIVTYDLYGILIDYLSMTDENTYILKEEARIHFEYLISKFFNEGIQDYLDCIPDECDYIRDIVSYVKRHGNLGKEPVSLRARIIIDLAILAENWTKDPARIFYKIQFINEKTINDALKAIIRDD